MPSTGVRILTTLKTWPSPRQWFEVFSIGIAIGVLAMLLKPNLIDLSLAPSLSNMVAVAIVAFFVPALFEELVFRGLLLPYFSWTWIALSNALYIAWHPIEALFLFPEAANLFFDPKFLLIVAVLGLSCTFVYVRAQSLWASIGLHWIVVVAWKAMGGLRFVF